jgi:hypothetical protein
MMDEFRSHARPCRYRRTLTVLLLAMLTLLVLASSAHSIERIPELAPPPPAAAEPQEQAAPQERAAPQAPAASDESEPVDGPVPAPAQETQKAQADPAGTSGVPILAGGGVVAGLLLAGLVVAGRSRRRRPVQPIVGSVDDAAAVTYAVHVQTPGRLVVDLPGPADVDAAASACALHVAVARDGQWVSSTWQAAGTQLQLDVQPGTWHLRIAAHDDNSRRHLDAVVRMQGRLEEAA